MNAPVYIDLGAYRGVTIARYRHSRNWKQGTRIFAWECNPYLKNVNYGVDVIRVNAAAWICEGEMDFYVSRKAPGRVQGSSVYKEKRTGNLNIEQPVRVRTVDFSAWVISQFIESEHVTLKMNIEGAEYDVLEHMVKTGAIEHIDTLFVQWHYKKCCIPEQRHLDIVRALRKYSHLTLYSGYGFLYAK